MANIDRKEEGGRMQERGVRPFWDPFGIFTALPGWSPFGALMPGLPRTFRPAFDVRETKDAYVFEADLPGMKEEGLEISLSGNQLSVRGTRESVHRDQNERYSCAERTYGTFERTFTLSDDAEPDRANAEFRDGVLSIEIGRREPQARRLSVSGAPGEENGGQQREEGGQHTSRASRAARSAHLQRAIRRQMKRKR